LVHSSEGALGCLRLGLPSVALFSGDAQARHSVLHIAVHNRWTVNSSERGSTPAWRPCGTAVTMGWCGSTAGAAGAQPAQAAQGPISHYRPCAAHNPPSAPLGFGLGLGSTLTLTLTLSNPYPHPHSYPHHVIAKAVGHPRKLQALRSVVPMLQRLHVGAVGLQHTGAGPSGAGEARGGADTRGCF